GGLVVDGNPRSWGIANSGNPYYSLINMDCDPQTPPSAPQGNAANSTVQFNLGVDYTLNWTGNVILTIIHCDGDTCELVYSNWCAKPPKQCISPGSGIPIDTSELPKNIVAASAKFSLKNRSNVRYISIELAERETNTQIIDGFAGIVDSNNNIVASGKRIERIDGEDMIIEYGESVVIELPKVFDGRDDDCQIIAFFMGDSVVKFNVILFDENVNPIGFETFVASQPISSVKTAENEYQNSEFLRISPNPTNNTAKIEFFNPIDGSISLQIIDLLGNEIHRIETGWKTFGIHSITANLNGLSSGSYFIVLKLPNGKVIPKPLIITN
ncbi:MAG: T9SS type A sorting domain-containing protein, partial [Candidatus Kapaibacteriota bacterium]